jgi:hypothetical protein
LGIQWRTADLHLAANVTTVRIYDGSQKSSRLTTWGSQLLQNKVCCHHSQEFFSQTQIDNPFQMTESESPSTPRRPAIECYTI